MTLGSLFDGLGTWQLAAVRAAITPVWSSEIEKFPLEVTARHFPDTLQLGDINKIDGAKIQPVDIIAAGTPCQDLSVAGKQRGLQGERSGLFFRAVDVIRQMQRATDGKFPRYFVWENVTGAFSSNGGKDFKTVIEECMQIEIPLPERWSNAGVVDGQNCQLAWRVLDAQYWGVPQRRSRIFLVVDFRGRRADQILFEPTVVRGDSAPSEDEKQNSAARTRSGVDSPSNCFSATRNYGQGWTINHRISETLNTYRPPIICHKNNGSEIENSIGFGVEASRPCADWELSPTLRVNCKVGVAYGIAGNIIDRKPKNGGNGKGVLEELSYTLTTVDRHAVGALQARDYKGVGNQYVSEGKLQVQNGKVRRLTPLECERLQGLPDGWSAGGSDTARYKAIGNGMALPCAEWILKRMKGCDCDIQR